MYKYYIFITALGVFIVSLSILIFLKTGNPLMRQSIQLDNKRLSELTKISYEIGDYYSSNSRLPSGLEELKQQDKNLSVIDPQTKNQYGYNMISTSKYELCAEFSTDSEANTTASKTYNKGYFCIPYTLSAYILKSKSVPTPTTSFPISSSQNTKGQTSEEKRKNNIETISAALWKYRLDNGDKLPSEITTTAKNISNTGADLCAILVPKYISALPIDPNGQVTDCYSPYDTGYTILKNTNNQTTIQARSL